MRLLSVLGASQALADHLVRHPEQWRELTDPTLGSTRPAAYAVRAGLLDGRRRRPARAGAGGDPARARGDGRPARGVPPRAAPAGRPATWPTTSASTTSPPSSSDLAAGDARGRAGDRRGPGWARTPPTVRLAVIAMGKCGGHELNYVSDVDVIFVHEPVAGDPVSESAAARTATQLATHLMRACSEHTAEGTIWPVDAALRPEGKAGPLVRTLAGMRSYYERWAKTWEFQALLKARPVAGDLELGQRVRGRSWTRWCGASRDATGSSPTCRPCVAGSSTPSRRARPSVSSSSVPAACATSSSPSSCSSSCTAGTTRRCARRPR